MIGNLGHPRTLALTATASPQVRAEIVAALELREPRIVVGEVNRPNIALSAHTVADDDAVTGAVVDRVRAAIGTSALVYAVTRRRVEDLAARLAHAGVTFSTVHSSHERPIRSGENGLSPLCWMAIRLPTLRIAARELERLPAIGN